MLERRPHVLLLLFLAALVVLNAWRLDSWGVEGLRSYLLHPIMQTTLFDFAVVLAVLCVFIHRDAKKLGLSWWWIVPTFPFMPSIGVLLYFIVRRRVLLARGMT